MSGSHADSVFREKYGPYALVAGGSCGLGEAFAEALARRGLNLVLLARNAERLEALARRLAGQYRVAVSACRADLADYDRTKEAIAELGLPIGLMVYNAAFAPIGSFESVDEERLAMAAAVNVKTPLLLSRLLCGPMVENRRGGIVLMSSLAGGQGCPKLAAYSATKAFNTVLAESLWKELRPHGIDVIGCCAGAVLTPGYRQAEKRKPAPGALTAERVAEQTLLALGRGPIVVPGAVNKLARFFLARLVSRRTAVDIMSKNTGGLV